VDECKPLDAGRVVGLDLRYKGLTGDIPAALGGLTALTARAYTRSQFSSS